MYYYQAKCSDVLRLTSRTITSRSRTIRIWEIIMTKNNYDYMIIVVKPGRICRTIRIWTQDMKMSNDTVCVQKILSCYESTFDICQERGILGRRKSISECRIKIITWLSKNPWFGEEQEKKYIGNTLIIYFRWSLCFQCVCVGFSVFQYFVDCVISCK